MEAYSRVRATWDTPRHTHGEQKWHPLIDGRLTVRLMRRVDWTTVLSAWAIKSLRLPSWVETRVYSKDEMTNLILLPDPVIHRDGARFDLRLRFGKANRTEDLFFFSPKRQ